MLHFSAIKQIRYEIITVILIEFKKAIRNLDILQLLIFIQLQTHYLREMIYSLYSLNIIYKRYFYM